MNWDPYSEPLGVDQAGNRVYLKDLWPSQREVGDVLKKTLKPEMYRRLYSNVYEGDSTWKELTVPSGERFAWKKDSTYVRCPPYFESMQKAPESVEDISGARILAVLGDSITTDHISPAGSIPKDSPAGRYLLDHGVSFEDFNSYGARRGNHEVMIRGTFAHIRLANFLAAGKEGGFTRHFPEGAVMTIFEAAWAYAAERVPLVIIAGKEYGSGSSRDWAAKGPLLLGVRAVIAESFERIHRSNLVGMGILPLEFKPGENWRTLGLTGEEIFSIQGIRRGLAPRKPVTVMAKGKGAEKRFEVIVRIDTPVELEYYRNGGILPYVLRKFL
jgi:aconitate hydratase